MSDLVTEDWTAFQFTRGVGAQRRFMITGPSDAEAARSLAPVAPGDELWLDGDLIAEMPSVSTPQGVLNFVVDVEYVPKVIDQIDDSQLARDPTYQPDVSLSSEPVDTDIHGNAITNSAGDPFQQNPTKLFPDIHYTYKRYEAEYNGPFAIHFVGKVNSKRFTMPGFGWVEEGQALCLRIAPASEYSKSNKKVLLLYSFQIREDGFKTRILDKGRRALTADGGKGEIYTTNADGTVANPASDDVLLFFGATYEDTVSPTTKYKAGPLGAAIVADTDVLPETIEQEDTGRGRFLRYQLYDEVDFNEMKLTE